MEGPGFEYRYINIGGTGNKVQLGNHYGNGPPVVESENSSEPAVAAKLTDREKLRHDAILRWLQFPRMDTRRKNIKPAHEKTFQWILNDSKQGPEDSGGFLKWLKTGSGVYWVSGKAGSGKSTLMKSVQADTRTKAALNAWSGGKNVICPSFYFWYLGTEMQQSTLGLLRSLLWQILSLQKNRISIVFPDWHFHDASMEPTTDELVEALHTALTCSKSDTHTCLFVDGLDEYKGNTIDLASLADSLAALGSLPKVKIVLASRPLETLKEKYSSCPHLKLQELTRPDIDKFISARLGENAVFTQMQIDHPEETRKILQELAERAEGVFLWVHIVVLNLLDGLTHRDEPSKLMARILELPKELRDLFLRMLETIPPEYQTDAYRLLQLSLTWILDRRFRIGPRALTLHLALQYQSIRPEHYNDISKAKTDMRRWLKNTFAIINTRCLGMLEVGDDSDPNSCALDKSPKVQFLHRSVVDFLNEEEIRTRVWKVNKSEFDVNVGTASALAMLMNTKIEQGDTKGMVTKVARTEKQLGRFMHYCRLAEASQGKPLTTIMDSVSMNMSSRQPDADNWPDQFLFHSIARLDHEKHFEYDFLGLAIASGCALYACEKLDGDDSDLVESRAGRPFLLYAVSPYPAKSNLMRGISSIMVAFLTEKRHSDPNQRTSRTTVWHFMLRHLKKRGFALQTRSDNNNIAEPGYHDEVLDAVRLMLQHGANCSASVGSKKDGSTAGDVIKGLQNSPCPCQYQMEVGNKPRTIRACKCEHSVRLNERIKSLVKVVEEKTGSEEEKRHSRNTRSANAKRSGGGSSTPTRRPKSRHKRSHEHNNCSIM